MTEEYAREVTRVAIGHMLLRWNELVGTTDDGEQQLVKLVDNAAVELMVDAVLQCELACAGGCRPRSSPPSRRATWSLYHLGMQTRERWRGGPSC